MKRIGVVVSPHVLNRFVERFATELGSTKPRDVTALIYSEVMHALEDGRKAATKPRWAAWAHRSKAMDGSRFVWNPQLSRTYVVRRMRDADRSAAKRCDFDETWVVRTVLPNNDLERDTEDLVHAARYRQEESRRLRNRRGRQG